MMKKFVFICVALLCANFYVCCRAGNTSGNQNVCPTPGSPININVYGKEGIKGQKGEKGDTGAKGDKGTLCNCSLQDPSKPSAHIEAENRKSLTYQAKSVIKNWSVSAPYSHLVGGMSYNDGKLTVPMDGRYYIYAQLYYRNAGRVYIRVNDIAITMIQPPSSGKDTGSMYAGGVFNMKTGDVITLYVDVAITSIYMWSYHSYFGAFLV